MSRKSLAVKKSVDRESELDFGDGNDLINPDDFKSITMKIDLVNSTTKTEIRDGKRIYGESAVKTKKDEHLEDLSIQIFEYAERGLTLEGPSRVCSSGHNLVISIVTSGAKPNIAFQASAKVDAVEKLPSGREQIRMTFTQFEEATWLALQGVYARRQEEILNFFRAVKG